MQGSKTGFKTLLACMVLPISALTGQEAITEVVELNSFTVYAGSQFLNSSPAVQLSDRMVREVRVDLQSRGGARYQTDISIRGGIFEGTGLMVGGLALFDPQTGHYFSEIPLDPAFFGGAYLLTGVENGIHGFNSTAGSINWQWAPINEGGSIYLRGGTDSYIGGGIRSSEVWASGKYEVSIMRETGDGSIENGDFDLTRVSGRGELSLGQATLRLFGGYLSKFYGWPGMYTGFSLNETDDYEVGLIGWQLDWTNVAQDSGHRIGGYWRQIDDDYEYMREAPNNYFEHKTEVFSLQGDGKFGFSATDVVYRWALVTDQLIRSTSLTNGNFTERDYGEASVLGRHRLDTDWGELLIYAGASLDSSSEDSTRGLPQVGFRTNGIKDSINWSAYLEYAESSQVPGYTVLNSAPSGLFGGNRGLGRETASVIEAGYSFQTESLSGKIVAFHRMDDDLVDWVFDLSTPTARQAAQVDMDVSGVESWFRWDMASRSVELGYIYLNKDETYIDEGIDASFYALNYARHRVLATFSQQLSEQVVMRVETEAREHPANKLRSGGETAFLINAELSWDAIFQSEWNFLLRGTNLTEDDFQVVPGTPGPGREVFFTLNRDW